MSLTETSISSPVPAFSHRLRTSPPSAGGCNSDLSNSSMGMVDAMARPASSHGYDLRSRATGVHGNNSLSLTETVVGPADVPPPSSGCTPPAAVGDNGVLGNVSSTGLTATVVNVDTSCEECNLPPDGSNTKSTKVQHIPHNLISQPSSKIQKSTRMPPIILSKLQRPKDFLKKNILFEEPRDNELHVSRFKAWSQEEKDVFSEKITTFGMDFTEISSFLLHKTRTDCIEYYSKHYKSDCFTKANKCLPAMMQSQEKCKNVIDAAPHMSGIATATATKSCKRTKTVTDDRNKPTKQICHGLMAHLQSDSLPDKGHHVESSLEEEYETGNKSVGEMNASSLQGMNCPFTNSGQAVSIIPETEVSELKKLNEDSCSNEEINKGEQEIWTNTERCRLIENIKKHGMGQCKNFVSNCKNDISIGKRNNVNSNINSTNSTNDKSISNMDSATFIIQSYSKVNENVSQPVMNADQGDIKNYVVGESERQGTLKRMTLPDVCHQKIPNGTIEGDQISSGEENPELCSAAEECNAAAEHSWNDMVTNENCNDDSKAPSDMGNPGSGYNPCSATNGSELSGHHEFEQPPEDSEALKISSKENDVKAKRDQKNPRHCVSSEGGCRIQLDCILNSQKEKEVIDISSPEVSEISAPPMLDSDEASKNNSHLPSSSGSAAQLTVYAKSSCVEVGIDLNIPLDVALPDVASEVLENNCAEPSIYLNEPCQTTDAAAIMHHESGIRARATTDLGGDTEAENDLTNVQTINQLPTTIRKTGHQPANQPSCVMLFGQVIYQAPSSGTNLTSSQGNEIVVHSRDMPSNTVVPVRARGGQVHTSVPRILRSAPLNLGQQAILQNTMPYSSSDAGPSLWRSAPVIPGQRAVLPNETMLYGSSNAVAAWPPLGPGSSALINMSHQQRHDVNMMPYNMLRAGVPYHWRSGSSSGIGLINFNDFNPGQQQWPSSILDMDTSRNVIGYPHLPGSTGNQAPTAIMASTTNLEGTSGSNTRFLAGGGRGRGRGRERGRGRAHNL